MIRFSQYKTLNKFLNSNPDGGNPGQSPQPWKEIKALAM